MKLNDSFDMAQGKAKFRSALTCLQANVMHNFPPKISYSHLRIDREKLSLQLKLLNHSAICSNTSSTKFCLCRGFSLITRPNAQSGVIAASYELFLEWAGRPAAPRHALCSHNLFSTRCSPAYFACLSHLQAPSVGRR